MKLIRPSFSVSVILLLFVTTHAQRNTKTLFTKDWKFILDSTHTYSSVDVNDASWRILNLPHDWSIEGNFSKDHPATPGGGALPAGIGWYRKTFAIPEMQKQKSIFIEFDGIYRNSEVWINGHWLGMRPNGYISFRYNLTPYLQYGSRQNVLAVKVDNSKQPNSRWYSGSGIYRNVWLTTVDQLHIDQWGTFITTLKISKTKASVAIETKVRNQSAESRSFVLKTIVFDATGKQVAIISSAGTTGINTSGSFVQSVTINAPKLWSTESPYLYKALSQVITNGKIIDQYETKFGIRSFHFDAYKGFSLNGKPMKIRGVCNHHDLGALGAAINTRALERQLEILKGMGCNGIRTSHNPPAPELLDLCDKMGFIVMDEAFDMWAKSKSRYDYHLDWKEWHRKDLEDMILRDRNHASVFIWSIGNEIGEQWGDKDTSGRTIARELVSIVKNLDTTRPIVTANNEINKWNNLLQSGAFDLIGYNYNHKQWNTFHETWPGKKLIVAESVSALQTRGHYDLVPFDTIRRWPKRWDLPVENANPDFTVSAYDHVSTPWGSTHEETLKVLNNDHVSGMFIWTGFDYLGEPTPYSWPARSSYFGIIDLAGFPKDVYYLYKSEWTSKPVLHIYPHWNWKQGDTVDVVAYYNNADEVELFLNGESAGIKKKEKDALHVTWRLPFIGGTVKAVSKKKGQTVLIKEVKTAGEAAKIILKADRTIIKADGTDLSFITAAVVDKSGVLVPKANNLIQFKINGAAFIAGVDNGSPTSHESFKGDSHTAMNGLALAVLQSNGQKGKIVLTASSAGLQPAAITVEAK